MRASKLTEYGVAAFLFLVSLLANAQEEFSPQKLVDAARSQIGKTLIYDGSYARLDYPNGDVPLLRGVCTDVVVRAYRGQKIDLQQRVHTDMQANFKLYPKSWGLKRPDANIDHRRVPNLMVYFARFGKKLPISTEAEHYLPGDLVTWRLDNGLPHIGIVSDKRSWFDGKPLVIHNIGWGTRENDMLFDYTITGHFRFHPPPPK